LISQVFLQKVSKVLANNETVMLHVQTHKPFMKAVGMIFRRDD